MAIIIKKKSATREQREPAPLADNAAVAEAATPVVERTPKQILDSWKDLPPAHTKPTQCAYCQQWYIKPCNAQQYDGCHNYQHLMSSKKAKP
jgi:hypothetical protein